MKPEILKIGLPTNSRLSEDLRPFTDALCLEGKNGRMKAKGLEGAEFRLLRVQDIASFLRQGMLDIGLAGLDVMIEDRPFRPDYARIKAAEDLRMFGTLYVDTRGSIKEREVENNFTIQAGEPTKMTLLVRKEEAEEISEWSQIKEKTPRERYLQWQAFEKKGPLNIVTSYPKIANASVERELFRYFNASNPSPLDPALCEPLTSYLPVRIREVAGKVEEIVSNADFPGWSIALDIVKSGKTAKECGLVPFGEPILESTPGIYTFDFEREDRTSRTQIQDCIKFLREKLKEAQLPTTYGPGRNFVEEGLKAWRL